MKGIHEFVILVLWMIAILATFFIIRDSGKFTYLAPIYTICMIGSLITMRALRKNDSSSKQSSKKEVSK
ncbi:hypothetical protein GF337_05860 [candidate division KSB1 bacterium]|nr:hypothetical protein [candidate division KSB1 bacterium]